MSTTPVANSKQPLLARRLFTIVPFVLIAAGALIAGILSAVMRPSGGHLLGAVHVGHVELRDQTQDAARTALQQFAQERQTLPVALRFAPETGIKHTWKLTAEQLGLGIDVDATLNDAIKAGHENGVAQLAHLLPAQLSHFLPGQNTLPIAPHSSIDTAQLRKALRRIAWTIDRKPRKARLVIQKGASFAFRPERPGFALDIEGSIAAVTQAWNAFNAAPGTPDASASTPPSTGDTGSPGTTPPGDKNGVTTPQTEKGASETAQPSAPQPTVDATLVGKTVQPSVTVNDLKQIDGMLGSFSTHFVDSSSRGSNIALAAGRINGTVLAPGEVFSYNRIVGPRVASMGFKTAPVIIHGELVPGIGGGICQVSSTLYNAVLLSDLEIVTRSHHAFPVHYLPAGRDATVVDGEIDFRFRNNTDTPIYIAGGAPDGRLYFSIWGKRHPDRTVSIQLVNHTIEPAGVERESDPTLRAGREVVKSSGHTGHRVTVYRVVRENGQVHRELISRDHYHPFPTLVLVGTRTERRSMPRVKRSAIRRAAPADSTQPPAATQDALPPTGDTTQNQ